MVFKVSWRPVSVYLIFQICTLCIVQVSKTRWYATKICLSKCPEDQFQLTLFSRYAQQPYPSTTGWKYPIKEWKVAWVANAWDIKRNIPWVAGRVQAEASRHLLWQLATPSPASDPSHSLTSPPTFTYLLTHVTTYLLAYLCESQQVQAKESLVRDPLTCAQALWHNILL